ncbi:MAG TPA: YtxH domain-containing protein [Acidobacteriota bacterium]|jgi:gas vesicle protein
MGRNNGRASGLVLFLGGAVAGATLALLFAPQSGEKTRKEIQKFGRRALNRADAFQSELREQVNDLIESVVETSSHGMERGKALTEKIRSEVVDILDTGRKVLENEKNRVQQIFR